MGIGLSRGRLGHVGGSHRCASGRRAGTDAMVVANARPADGFGGVVVDRRYRGGGERVGGHEREHQYGLRGR